MAKRKPTAVPLNRGDRFVAACNRLRLTETQPFRLDEWWEQRTREIFGTLDDGGLRVYKRATITTGKKNGKTTTCGAWIAVLLTVDGSSDQSVVSISGSLDQAGHLYKAAKKFLERSGFPPGQFRFSDQYRRITVMSGPSKGAEFRALAAKTETQHGVIPTVVLIDEAVFVEPDLWQAVEESMSSAAEPLAVSISHADATNPESVYQKHLVTARQIRDGLIDIPWWYVALCELGPKDDWRDWRTWVKANPTLGRIKKLDAMKRAYEDAVRTPSKLTRFRQWHLNQFTESSNAFLAVTDWEACATPLPLAGFIERLRGRRCVVGLDLSATQDLTAAAAMFPPEDDEPGPQILTAFFCPEGTIEQRSASDGVNYRVWADAGWITPTPGRAVDYEALRRRLNEWADEFGFEIATVGYDRKLAHDLIVRLTDDGFECAPIGQGFGDLSAPTKALEKLILDRRLTHDANPVMRWCMANAVADRDAIDNVKLSKARSTGRIDGAAALVDAMFCYDRMPAGHTITDVADLISFA